MNHVANDRPLIGCVADDFTGAGDVASFIAKEGADCLLIDGVPAQPQPVGDYDAVVIALKSRSHPVQQAIQEMTAAFDWLLSQQIRTVYFKYCSTFDSTPEGNIGPVIDHLLEKYDLPFTILCPALPVNQRVVRDGKLYVCGVPLDESPMRYHPLNPMWDSEIINLMQAQSKYPCFKLTHEMYAMSDEELQAVIEDWKAKHTRFTLVVDYFEEAHGQRIARLFKGLLLLTGGSALPGYLFKELSADRKAKAADKTLILAGSCSQMTLKQIAFYLEQSRASLRVIPADLLDGKQTADQIWSFVEQAEAESVLIYSSQAPHEIAEMSRYSQSEISAALEQLMAELGRRAVESGLTKIIVAGGETSGAVMKALDENAYEIGPSVAPGVPILIPLSRKQMRLVLKSGNFGQEDFFTKALELVKEV